MFILHIIYLLHFFFSPCSLHLNILQIAKIVDMKQTEKYVTLFILGCQTWQKIINRQTNERKRSEKKHWETTFDFEIHFDNESFLRLVFNTFWFICANEESCVEMPVTTFRLARESNESHCMVMDFCLCLSGFGD